MKKEQGFTLVELLAVIVILGVLLSIAIPAVSKVNSSSKEQTYITNALTYIKQAKTLSYELENDLVVYNINELTEELSSPFGGVVRGKVAAVRNSNTGNYDYYIYMQDENDNIIGNLTYNGVTTLISEEDIRNNYVVKTREEIINSRENQEYKKCLYGTECTSEDETEFNACLQQKRLEEPCNNYDYGLSEFYNSVLLNANIYDDKDIVVIGDSYSANTKIYPDYAVNELEYSTGVGVTINLNDSLKDVPGTIIRRIDSEHFDVLLDSDYYPTDTTANGAYSLLAFESQLKTRKMSPSPKVAWKNIDSFRVLSINDINYFASVLEDSGKITCNSKTCTNNISNENYQKILNLFKVGNLNVRRYYSVQERYYADTWIMDEEICKYDYENSKFIKQGDTCAKIDFYSDKVFMTDNSNTSYANMKIVVRINKSHIN